MSRTRSPFRLLHHHHQPLIPLCPRRTFLSSFLPDAPSQPQTLTASRKLPYASAQLYDIIADIDAYSDFLPYCTVSRVTAWTPPDPHTHRRYPSRGDLTAGWGAIEQTYSSRVFCIPCQLVEAISGDARTEITASLLRQHGLVDPGPDPKTGDGTAGEAVFKSLVTRWTVTPSEAAPPDAHRSANGSPRRDWSEVHLSLKFCFANPLYGAVSATVADRVAPMMVEAFVGRAKRILG
ncbi:dehydrase and lipid transport-domain-containing protein [Xylariaceae sp. FL0016]|nr:dehydrase and lipid transport-domain-containing protein [Xylariaceae sp. FL0016]